MSKIALMTLLNRADSPLSMHFGKAKWVMVHDTEEKSSRFVQNHGLNGRSVVQLLLQEGCSEVICSEIGDGAVRNLENAGIRGWLAPAETPAPRALQMHAEGALQPIHSTKTSGEHRGCGHHDAEAVGAGCGCQHRHGEGHGCCH